MPGLSKAMTDAAAADEILHRIAHLRPDLDKEKVLQEASKRAASLFDSTSALDVLRQWWSLVTECKRLPFEA